MTRERVVIEITESGARLVSREIDGVSKASDNATKSTDLLKRALAGLGAAFSVGQLLQIIDGYTSLINRLKLVTESTKNLVAINKELFEISNRTFASYNATITLYSRFAFATEKLGISQRRLLGIVESINLAATLSGTGAENQKAGLVQLSQAISSNLLRGDELTSILENVPRIAKVIADGMNVTIGDLKKLGEEGKITANDIVQAFEKSAPKLKEEFDKTVPTVGNALTVLKNTLTRTLGELDQSSGVSRLLAASLLSLSGSAEDVIRAVLGLAIALGVNYAVQGVGVAIAATRALTVAMSANPFMALVKGIVIAIGLLTAFSDKIMIGGGSVANLADLAVASFESIKAVFSNTAALISSKFPEISTAFSSVFSGVSFSIKDMLLAVARGVDAVIGMFVGLRNSIPATLGSVGPVLELVFNNIFNSILKSAAAWYNALLEMINFINSKLGLGTLDKIQAVQIPLTQKAQALGSDISKAVSQGIKSEKSAQQAILDLIDRADQIAKTKVKISDSDISNVDKPGKGNNALSDDQKRIFKQRLDFIAALKDEENQLGLTKTQLLAYKAAQLGVLSESAPIIAAIDAKVRALEEEKNVTEQLKRDQEAIKRLTQETLTPLERYNEQVAELNRLFEIPDGKGLSLTVYNRALEKAKEELKDADSVGRNSFNNLNQYAIQAARNIQSSFANFLFDPFNDGIKGMLTGFLNAIRRMVAEIAAAKFAQAIGLSDLGAGGGSFSIGKATSTIMGGISNGFGIGNLLGNGLSSVGRLLGLSSLTSIGAGASGAASAGVFGAGGLSFLSGPGTALEGLGGAAGAAGEFGAMASIGSGLAAAAGPAMIALIATQGLKMLAGNKRLGGGFGNVMNAIGDLPIIGDMLPIIPLINGLFGRGPLKQKETQLVGNVGLEGLLSGYLTTNFKAKGGLLVGSKRDFAGVNLLTGAAETDNNKALKGVAESMVAYANDLAFKINSSVLGISSQIKAVSESLNISLDPLKDFNYRINLISESGKALTDAQIDGEISNISEAMVKVLIPSIDNLAKHGETATDTFTRLGQEFQVLNLAAISTGRGLAEARAAILSIPLAQRTAIVDQLGGVDSANQKVSFFIDNFLSSSDRLGPTFEMLDSKMRALGFSANITKEDFVKLIQSVGKLNGITIEQYSGLLGLASDFLNFDKLRQEVGTETNNVVNNEQRLLDIRSQLGQSYTEEASRLKSLQDRMTGFADNIREFRAGLLLGQLSPLTPGQKLDQARLLFNQTRTAAAAGDEAALQKLPSVAEEFLKASQVYNASGEAFKSDFQLVQDVLKNSENTARDLATIAGDQLDQLTESVGYLIEIKTNTASTNSLIGQLIQLTLQGPGNPTITTDAIKSYMSANPNITPDQIAKDAAKYGVNVDQLQAAGYDTSKLNSVQKGLGITNKDIVDFVNSHTPMEIYKAMELYGVSFNRLSSAAGIPLYQIEQFARDNNLPFLDKGTDYVGRAGLAMLHKGEAVGPSSLPEKMERLIEEVIELRKDNEKQAAAIIRITELSNDRNASKITQSNADISKEDRWSKRNKVTRK